jgi:hypothetical protein
MSLCLKGLHDLDAPEGSVAYFLGGGRAWGNRCRGCRRASQNANNFHRYMRDLRKRIGVKQQRIAALTQLVEALGIADHFASRPAPEPSDVLTQ